MFQPLQSLLESQQSAVWLVRVLRVVTRQPGQEVNRFQVGKLFHTLFAALNTQEQPT